MLQRPEYGEGHPERVCCYCGGYADTVDHVPSKVFLDEPYPDNLPVVPCCRKCSEEFSLDEEYVAVLLECVRLQTFSPDFYRPTDVVNLWGDPTKAKAKLKWNPSKTSFEELVKLMVEHDIAKVVAEGAAAKVRTNLAEYLEKGIVK